MITQKEAKQIIDFVIREIKRRQFPYITDSKVDFGKPTVGLVTGGNATTGGQIAEEAIFDRHINPDAEIAATKIVVVDNECGYFWYRDSLEDALYELADNIDGGTFAGTYGQAVESFRDIVNGGTFIGTEIIDGGSF